MDAIEQVNAVNAEIADIDIRLGRTKGLQASARREADRLDVERQELEEARRRKECERQGLLKALAEGNGGASGARRTKTKPIPPSVQKLITFLLEKGCEVGPADVATRFKLNDHNARNWLWKGTLTGQVKKLGDGLYAHVSVVAPLPEAASQAATAVTS